LSRKKFGNAESEAADSCFRRNDRGKNSVSTKYQDDETVDSCFRRNDKGNNPVFRKYQDDGKVDFILLLLSIIENKWFV
jgi:hypothetical protein